MSTTKRKGLIEWLKSGKASGVRLDELSVGTRESCWRAVHDSKTFFLYLDLTGAGRHHCTCSDWSLICPRPSKSGMLCCHIAAAALRSDKGSLLLAPLLGAA